MSASSGLSTLSPIPTPSIAASRHSTQRPGKVALITMPRADETTRSSERRPYCSLPVIAGRTARKKVIRNSEVGMKME